MIMDHILLLYLLGHKVSRKGSIRKPEKACRSYIG